MVLYERGVFCSFANAHVNLMTGGAMRKRRSECSRRARVNLRFFLLLLLTLLLLRRAAVALHVSGGVVSALASLAGTV